MTWKGESSYPIDKYTAREHLRLNRLGRSDLLSKFSYEMDVTKEYLIKFEEKIVKSNSPYESDRCYITLTCKEI